MWPVGLDFARRRHLLRVTDIGRRAQCGVNTRTTGLSEARQLDWVGWHCNIYLTLIPAVGSKGRNCRFIALTLARYAATR